MKTFLFVQGLTNFTFRIVFLKNLLEDVLHKNKVINQAI